MAGLSPAHLLIILVIALVVIGPGKLPEVGAAIGKSIREFQKASGGITDGFLGTPVKPVMPQQPLPQQPMPQQPMPQQPMPMQLQPPAQSYYAAQPAYAPQPYQQPQYGAPVYPVQPQYGAPVDLAGASPAAPQPEVPITDLPAAGPKVD
ncbi:MAG: twin-arginine translocase TatA/TatE family subunit [Candidatus Limnocylindrales bacterium]